MPSAAVWLIAFRKLTNTVPARDLANLRSEGDTREVKLMNPPIVIPTVDDFRLLRMRGTLALRHPLPRNCRNEPAVSATKCTGQPSHCPEQDFLATMPAMRPVEVELLRLKEFQVVVQRLRPLQGYAHPPRRSAGTGRGR
jgi:hypothetical protein